MANALEGPGGGKLKLAQSEHDRCAVAKAEFGLEMSVLKGADGQEFHNWQQFGDQRYQKEQDDVDKESGLRNTERLGPHISDLTASFPAIASLRSAASPCQRWSWLANTMERLDRNRCELWLNGCRMHTWMSSRKAHFVYAEQPVKFVRDVEVFLAPGSKTQTPNVRAPLQNHLSGGEICPGMSHCGK